MLFLLSLAAARPSDGDGAEEAAARRTSVRRPHGAGDVFAGLDALDRPQRLRLPLGHPAGQGLPRRPVRRPLRRVPGWTSSSTACRPSWPSGTARGRPSSPSTGSRSPGPGIFAGGRGLGPAHGLLAAGGSSGPTAGRSSGSASRS
ncbi:MAG: hypothetical protein MZU79_07545 [Anaerotruncus sp.]|nr:hypothetical protein [Anaerotruncus sp.]